MSLGALLPRTEREEAYFTLTHVVKLVGEFIRRVRRNHIDCRQERPRHLGVALSVSISFTTLASVPLPAVALPAAAYSCAFLFFPTTHPPLAPGSHSIRRSRSVVTALRLYKFYIIFMRHKVVEKPAEEGRERVRTERERSASEGKSLSVRISSLSHPFRPPASCRFSHVAGRSGSHPLVFACPRGMQREGNADRARGDDASC